MPLATILVEAGARSTRTRMIRRQPTEGKAGLPLLRGDPEDLELFPSLGVTLKVWKIRRGRGR